MLYLHDQDPPIQHRDLKAENCLIVVDEGQYRVKITDFGLSKSTTNVTQTSARSVGTETHMAPELFIMSKKSNEDRKASDVYSYGIVIWEVYSRKVPYKEERQSQEMQSISAAVIQGVRPSPDPSAPPALIDLMKDCWAQDTFPRPSFERIVETMKELENDEEVTMPPPPFILCLFYAPSLLPAMQI